MEATGKAFAAILESGRVVTWGNASAGGWAGPGWAWNMAVVMVGSRRCLCVWYVVAMLWLWLLYLLAVVAMAVIYAYKLIAILRFFPCPCFIFPVVLALLRLLLLDC